MDLYKQLRKSQMKKIHLPVHLNSKVVTSVASIVVFAGAVSYATLKIEAATEAPRLPANAACLKLANDVSNALEGSQNQIVAVLEDKPKPQVDLSSIKTSYKECTDTKGTTQVQVSK